MRSAAVVIRLFVPLLLGSLPILLPLSPRPVWAWQFAQFDSMNSQPSPSGKRVPLQRWTNFAREDPAELVRQLGDKDYYVRQRAQDALVKIGIDAFYEVKAALDDPDPEIAERAKMIFSRIESDATRFEHPVVLGEMEAYAREKDPVQNLWRLRYIGSRDAFPKAEGLPSLCRVLRFDRSVAMRAEAAKVILVCTPVGTQIRRSWLQTVKRSLGNPKDDPVLQLVDAYVSAALLVQDIRFLKEPPREKVEEAKRLTARFSEALDAFFAVPEYDSVLPNSCVDILTRYALAELQDVLELDGECAETLEKIRALVPQRPASSDLRLLCSALYDYSPWAARYETAGILLHRGHLRWAEAELDQALEHAKDTRLVGFLYARYADLFTLREEYARAAEMLEKAEEPLKALESDGTATGIAGIRIGHSIYLRAREAAANGDWATAKTLVDKTLETFAENTDALILRYRLNEHLSDLDAAYKMDTTQRIDRLLNHLRNQANEARFDDLIPDPLNEWAWLAAGTERSLEVALECIETVLKACPENLTYMDTQAHVYAALGRYDQAVEIQEQIVRLVPEVVLYRSALERFRAKYPKH